MKRTGFIAVALVLLCGVSSYGIDAAGSAFGNLTTAKAIGQAKGDFGGGVGIADATSFFGSFTYGLSEYMDGRIRVGMYDPGDNVDAELAFALDMKYQLWDAAAPTTQSAIDLSIGGFLEYLGGDVSILELGGFGLVSYEFAMSNGQAISPYGRLNLRMERISWDLPEGFEGDDSETNLEFGIHGGLAWQITPTIQLFGEFQLDGNDGVLFGVDFNVM